VGLSSPDGGGLVVAARGRAPGAVKANRVTASVPYIAWWDVSPTGHTVSTDASWLEALLAAAHAHVRGDELLVEAVDAAEHLAVAQQLPAAR